MSAYQLDVPELYAHLDYKRTQAGRSWRDVAAELGLSRSTFSRLADGHRPDADALVTLIAWLDIDLAYVTKPKEQQ
ncbi:helix-turn-helix domain-containing protein [Streptomyces sp. NPDC051310]|uniref:helix-turn-helix domain-containing protein n=1 Tax=Streptomyces sp. NPDC051310 TaxID=3365649 RepID=UPI0037B64674